MKLTFREMKKTDWDIVKNIFEKGIKDNKATFENTSSEYDEWDKTHLKKCRIIAEIDNIVVGWAAFSPFSHRKCYEGVAEISIYIDPEFSRRGIGKKLLKYSLELAENEGIWTVQSSIMSDNEASLSLHETLGFRQVGHRENIAKDSYGNWRNTILLEKRF
ncbi:MAG: GNAT family N-acetyltransferase [Cellulosilyticaceae bacterium]